MNANCTPQMVHGPYSDLQLAKEELKQIAKNGKNRLIVEIIHDIIKEDPHEITGISQNISNGFENYWDDSNDIHDMVFLVSTIHPALATTKFGM